MQWLLSSQRISIVCLTASSASHMIRGLESMSADGEADEITPHLCLHPARRGVTAFAASFPDVNLSKLAHHGRWAVEGFHTFSSASAGLHQAFKILDARSQDGRRRTTRRLSSAWRRRLGGKIMR